MTRNRLEQIIDRYTEFTMQCGFHDLCIEGFSRDDLEKRKKELLKELGELIRD